jgi:histidine triad (HIT) family protein
MRDCIFCQILDGNAPASLVHENDLVAAFMDIQPVNLGHLLVVPKRLPHSWRT